MATAKKAIAAKTNKTATVAKKVKAKPVVTLTAEFTTMAPFDVLTGTVVEVADGHVTIDHKKPRSSKMLRSVVPMNQVLYFSEAAGFVVRKAASSFIDSLNIVSVSVQENGMLVLTDDEGGETICNPSCVTISGDADGETAPVAKKEKAEPAAAKKGKKPVAEEEEEEEEEAEEEEEEEEEEEAEEEEEEEEEEEAPKAKKGAKPVAKKAAAAKPAAKKEKKPADDEEEEEEEEEGEPEEDEDW